jgi:Helix-turn-helix domain
LPTLARRSSIASELSEKHFLPILKKSERLLLRRVGGLIAEKTDELLKRQTSSSPDITLLKPEITLFKAGYVAAVLETTGELAGELAQAVGRRKGLAKQQRRWVKSQFLEFFHRMTSAKVAEALFRQAFGLFPPANEEQSEEELVRQVTRTKATSRLLHSAYEAIEHAVALYPTHERSGEEPRKIALAPSPGEQVADPIRYPSMTVTDVQQLFHKSRSSVNRWLDEGKLKRAAMGEKPGKRRSCLILTSSVKELLKESSE